MIEDLGHPGVVHVLSSAAMSSETHTRAWAAKRLTAARDLAIALDMLSLVSRLLPNLRACESQFLTALTVGRNLATLVLRGNPVVRTCSPWAVEQWGAIATRLEQVETIHSLPGRLGLETERWR